MKASRACHQTPPFLHLTAPAYSACSAAFMEEHNCISSGVGLPIPFCWLLLLPTYLGFYFRLRDARASPLLIASIWVVLLWVCECGCKGACSAQKQHVKKSAEPQQGRRQAEPTKFLPTFLVRPTLCHSVCLSACLLCAAIFGRF